MNITSIYKKTIFYTISKGVFFRLALFTMFNNSNKDKRLDELYLILAKALIKASLIKEKFPILKTKERTNYKIDNLTNILDKLLLNNLDSTMDEEFDKMIKK